MQQKGLTVQWGLFVSARHTFSFCMEDLRFDKHQFDRKPTAFGAKADGKWWEDKGAKVSFNDYQSMHTVSITPQASKYLRWRPAFALNDKQLKHVIAQRAWDYARRYGTGTQTTAIPEEFLNNLPKLEELVASKSAKIRQWGIDRPLAESLQKHAAYIEQMHGYLPLIASIAWNRWRQGWTAPQIAEDIGMQPCNVRMHLYRLSLVASRLGYETFAPHPTKGRPKPLKPGRTLPRRNWTLVPRKRGRRVLKWTPEKLAEIKALYEKGVLLKDIAVAVGTNSNMIGHLLFKRSGVKPRRIHRWTPEELAPVELLRAGGRTWKQIGFDLGIDRQTVRVAYLSHRHTC